MCTIYPGALGWFLLMAVLWLFQGWQMYSRVCLCFYQLRTDSAPDFYVIQLRRYDSAQCCYLIHHMTDIWFSSGQLSDSAQDSYMIHLRTVIWFSSGQLSDSAQDSYLIQRRTAKRFSLADCDLIADFCWFRSGLSILVFITTYCKSSLAVQWWVKESFLDFFIMYGFYNFLKFVL